MPKKGYKQTEEHRRKTGLSKMGNKNGIGHMVTEENRKKLSERMKGNKINLGKKYSQERRDKIGRANAIALRGRKKSQESIEKQLLTKIKNGNMIDPKLLSEFENYRREVWIETRKHKKKLFDGWDGFCFYIKEYIKDFYDKNDYNNPNFPVVDHKTSIFNGFNDNIEPKIIGRIDNLCICSRKINGIKNKKNDI